MNKKLMIKKVLRFISIYGISRTLIKVIGRKRPNIPFWILFSFPNYLKNGKTIGFIGCGHQTYSSLAYFITTLTNFKIIWTYDINKNAQKKNTGFILKNAENIMELLNTQNYHNSQIKKIEKSLFPNDSNKSKRELSDM